MKDKINKSPTIKAIFGLGNPSETYAFSYHNVGQIWLSRLTEKKWQAYAKFQTADIKPQLEIPGICFAPEIHLVKPLVFMNESGRAVKAALQKFKLKPDEILITHDDSDILLGKYKVSWNRGAAGHNGVLSVMRELNTKSFWRLRLGIRKDRKRAGEFVLAKITPADKIILYSMFDGFTKKPSEKEKSAPTS